MLRVEEEVIMSGVADGPRLSAVAVISRHTCRHSVDLDVALRALHRVLRVSHFAAVVRDVSLRRGCHARLSWGWRRVSLRVVTRTVSEKGVIKT